ncbi:nitrogen fixation protein FixH [Rhizobium aquaticum]|uniref:Nitrogen fixation protein FixH n=1 Tax=Rhizobium aquaticum TaxID=1549636 RepID=A0ABV2IV39_9HYPH
MATATNKPSGFTFTGWHFLAIMIAFFGTVIAVNFTMAWYATHSWSGLVADDTFKASQQFNAAAEHMRQMAATGIRGELNANREGIRYVLTHPQRGPVPADEVVASFHRPVGTLQDFTVTLKHEGDGVFTTNHEVLPGEWIVDLKTNDDGKMVYHEAIRVHVFPNR